MELTKNQIQQIHTFIKNKGVSWYDVRVEIVDHFANALEYKLVQNPNLDFKDTLNIIYAEFKDVKFKKIIKEKTKVINKSLWSLALKHFKTFFKFPKIILSIFVFFILNQLMLSITDKKTFFDILHVILMIISVLSLIKGISYVHQKHQLLALANTNQLFLGINSFAVIFSSLNSYTKDIHSIKFYQFKILIFVLFILLIITVFHVYHKVKNEVQNQYPEIKII